MIMLPCPGQVADCIIVDLYTPPSPPRTTLNTTNDAADEEVAERFRRDFLDAVQNRNIKRPVPVATNSRLAKPGADAQMKGPKLGGSRSARAAMHAAQKAGKK